jgi:hypothetical protein
MATGRAAVVVTFEAKAIRKLQHPVRARKLEGFLDQIAPTVSTA